jgi:hypothetical protein
MKIKVAVAALCVASFVAGVCIQKGFGYDNKGGYDQPAYVNTQGYDNIGGYNNRVNYITEFIKGEKREQMVQAVRDGKKIQAVVPVGTPDEEIAEDIKK